VQVWRGGDIADVETWSANQSFCKYSNNFRIKLFFHVRLLFYFLPHIIRCMFLLFIIKSFMELVKFSDVEDKVINIRGKNVILDSDVAMLYGVETKRVNEALKNNPEKFPTGYTFRLISNDWKNLKSKFSTSNRGGKNKLPTAFTEKGLYMLATILKSPKATETTITIIEVFAKFRELSQNIADLSKNPDEYQQKHLIQKSGEIFADIFGEDLRTTGSETSFEVNFELFKVKHTVKRETEAK
jgi:hypothetical protein